MKKLCILAPFCSLPDEPFFNRFLYLAELLSETYNVTLVTSNFRHFDKKYRQKTEQKNKFEIIFIDEPGYKTNVSLQRVYSHRIFFNNFKRWFECNKLNFDIMYSAYPLISTNKYLAKFKIKWNYKLVVDIQDVWPEAISSAVPFVKSIPLMLLPFTRSADYVYKNADAIIAVSDTYAERAKLGGFQGVPKTVYIGADVKTLSEATPAVVSHDKINLIYVGTLSHSYDLDTVIKGVMQDCNVVLHIFGGGPDEAKLRGMVSDNVMFHGFVDYEKMISFAKGCDIAVNPIISSSAASVTNKISDYLSLGIPVLNSQSCKEVECLLLNINHQNYLSGDVRSFSNALNSLKGKPWVKSEKLLELFDRRTAYQKIVEAIEDCK